MTDRAKGFVVTLEEDIRVDDVEGLVAAIEMMRGVASVQVGTANFDDVMNRERFKHEFRNKFNKFINEELNSH